ncbi:MAG: hypothetical protein QW622_03410 [Candidatus Pacearchaeota archaeon]
MKEKIKEIRISEELIKKLQETAKLSKDEINECLKDVNKCLAEIKERVEKIEKAKEEKKEEKKEEQKEETKEKVRVSVKDFIEHIKKCPDCQEVVKSIVLKQEEKQKPKLDHSVDTYFKPF